MKGPYYTDLFSAFLQVKTMREQNTDRQDENRKRRRAVLLLIALLLIVFGAASVGYYLYGEYEARRETPSTTVAPVTETSATDKTVENPIDFAELTAQNKEIYAWIKVPGTKVDYPIVQSATSDEFYLKHDAYTRQWKASGAVYIELGNTKTFEDRVTVIYGHNGYSDSMFTTLHLFEDKAFFDAHEEFYIYTPEAKRTYRIVSAFKYDDRHILNSFDFQDMGALRDFLDTVQNPQSNNKNVRKPLDNELTINDNIVVLSTCFTNQRSNRYLVCGELIKNEKTS